MRKLAVLTCMLAFAGQVHAAQSPSRKSALINAYDEAASIGMKLAARNAFHHGKLSHAVNACIQHLRPDNFRIIAAALIKRNLTPRELRTADAFFRTPVGEKYAEFGLIQIYLRVGQPPPKPLPKFSRAEYRKLQIFSHTSAGRKLILHHVLQSDAAHRALMHGIRALLRKCRASP